MSILDIWNSLNEEDKTKFKVTCKDSNGKKFVRTVEAYSVKQAIFLTRKELGNQNLKVSNIEKVNEESEGNMSINKIWESLNEETSFNVYKKPDGKKVPKKDIIYVVANDLGVSVDEAERKISRGLLPKSDIQKMLDNYYNKNEDFVNETSESTKKAAKEYLDKKGYHNYLKSDYGKNKLALKIAGEKKNEESNEMTPEAAREAFEYEGIKVAKVTVGKKSGEISVIIGKGEDLEKATQLANQLGVKAKRIV